MNQKDLFLYLKLVVLVFGLSMISCLSANIPNIGLRAERAEPQKVIVQADNSILIVSNHYVIPGPHNGAPTNLYVYGPPDAMTEEIKKNQDNPPYGAYHLDIDVSKKNKKGWEILEDEKLKEPVTEYSARKPFPYVVNNTTYSFTLNQINYGKKFDIHRTWWSIPAMIILLPFALVIDVLVITAVSLVLFIHYISTLFH